MSGGLLNSIGDFFINSDEDTTGKPGEPKPKEEKVTFPKETSSNVFPTATNNSMPTMPTDYKPVENPFIDKLIEAYDSTFNKLNQPGYNFFTYYKAVNKSGVDNPQVYEMAFDLGQSMDSTITKALLLSQADYYSNELNKTHDTLAKDGQTKSNALINSKNSEATSLVTDLNLLKQQLQNIQSQITEKQNTLAQIDNKYQPDIDNITLKLAANDIARDTFINKINKVKTNIVNILK